MENSDRPSLEQMLLDSMHSDARARESGKEDEQAEGLKDICSAVSRLLGKLLETDARWNRYWWVDSILPVGMDHYSAHKNLELRLYGLMIWGEKGIAAEWVEPCSITLGQAGGELKYQLGVGDASRGLGKAPYRTSSEEMVSMIPAEWQFELCN